MVLYTVVPMEAVMGEADTARLRVFSFGDARIEAVMAGDGRYRIHRLYSSDPADYLDERFMPGSRLFP